MLTWEANWPHRQGFESRKAIQFSTTAALTVSPTVGTPQFTGKLVDKQATRVLSGFPGSQIKPVNQLWALRGEHLQGPGWTDKYGYASRF